MKAREVRETSVLVESRILVQSLGSLSIYDGDGSEKRHISFNMSNVGEFFWSWILKVCVLVRRKKKN